MTTVHMSYGRLIYLEYMMQLSFTVLEQLARQNFQGDSHIFKAGQNNLTVHRFHVTLICPENMEQLSGIVSEY